MVPWSSRRCCRGRRCSVDEFLRSSDFLPSSCPVLERAIVAGFAVPGDFGGDWPPPTAAYEAAFKPCRWSRDSHSSQRASSRGHDIKATIHTAKATQRRASKNHLKLAQPYNQDAVPVAAAGTFCLYPWLQRLPQQSPTGLCSCS